MDQQKALKEIMKLLTLCEGDIERILEELYQRGYDDGYNDGYEEGEKAHE